RIQGTNNGSCYLVIAYAGEIRLYRVDDSGGLNFTLLAAASVDISAAPRRLRLESRGNAHKAYFNGVQVIDYMDITYSDGQPGIGGAFLGGPRGRSLTFDGGSRGPNTSPRSRSIPKPTLSLVTGKTSTCRYAATAGVAYESMANLFTLTGTTIHATTVTGL